MTMRSGLKTPIDAIPTPAFAVPYAAPKQEKIMAEAQPMAPKKGWCVLSDEMIIISLVDFERWRAMPKIERVTEIETQRSDLRLQGWLTA